MTTQAQIRALFWAQYAHLDARARRRRTRSKGHNAQDATTRTAFCDFVDFLHKAGEITDTLAFRATL